jgi:hypothetical protein
MENTKKQKLILQAIGGTITVVALFLSFCWYDWKLAVILFIALIGNNIENKAKQL